MGLVNKITKLATFSLLMCSTTFFVACGKQSDSVGKNNNVKTANVPSAKTCLSGSTITPSSGSWVTYQNSGFRPMGWNSYGGYGAGAYAYFGIYPSLGYGYGYGQYGYPSYGTNPWPYGTPYGYNGGVYNGGVNYGGGTISGGANQSCSCPSGTMPACDSTGLTCVSVYEIQGLGRNVAIYNYNGSSFVFDNYYGASNWQTGSSSACRIAQSCVVGTSSCGYGTCRPIRAGGTVGVCAN